MCNGERERERESERLSYPVALGCSGRHRHAWFSVTIRETHVSHMITQGCTRHTRVFQRVKQLKCAWAGERIEGFHPCLESDSVKRYSPGKTRRAPIEHP